ncbi:NOT2/NOT3/NOT5 family [Abeliophyllum distichum]|uniref:NOT2/NOT3/NOT5 family n=1 Tax=Abeliophyllum distichum TaxID=126358 RepID=A0ABD1NX39_9LAMI
MWMQPPSDGSNSKVLGTLCRASAPPFSPQSCSSSGVLNLSGGTVQGLHNVSRNVNISNVHWPYASTNSANIGGLSNSVQQDAGSLMQNHNIGYSLQNQEFNIEREEFPCLPGIQDGLSALGFSEFPGDTHHKEHIQMRRSSGFNYGNAYPTRYPQQQHRASSSGVSGNQDLHLRGFEQSQQFQPCHSYFANQFMHKDMELQSVPNQFEMHGLLKIIKKENPGLSSLAVGTDFTKLGLNLTSTEPLFNTFASPWADITTKLETECNIPKCYNDRQPPALEQIDFTNFQLNTLLYIFYSMPKDEAQLFAANELGWFYHRKLRLWLTRPRDKVPVVKTSNYERGSYFIFNPCTWQLSRKDSFILDYDKIERMPFVPRN